MLRPTLPAAPAHPAPPPSLRAIDTERYAVVDESRGGALLEEIEESKAFFQVYDGAVYMHQASGWGQGRGGAAGIWSVEVCGS